MKGGNYEPQCGSVILESTSYTDYAPYKALQSPTKGPEVGPRKRVQAPIKGPCFFWTLDERARVKS